MVTFFNESSEYTVVIKLHFIFGTQSSYSGAGQIECLIGKELSATQNVLLFTVVRI